MIIYIAAQNNHGPIEHYLETWGKPVSNLLKLLTYEQILNYESLPVATYIFSDLERLSPRKAESAALIRNQLERFGQDLMLLNHPTISKRRYSLLRHLYECSINHFNVYLLTEARFPERYPVFIRRVNDHKGSVTDLINSFEELKDAIQKMNRLGMSHEDAIITEFYDTADHQGLYRKYSAFIVNDQVIPRHVFFSLNWMLKSYDLLDENLLEEEWEYVTTNPHQQEIKNIFELASINYGRIDYSISNGRIQVWEINTNPTIGSFSGAGGIKRQRVNQYFADNFNNAIQHIDAITQTDNSTKILINNKVSKSNVKTRRLKSIVHRSLKFFGLLNYEDGLYEFISKIKQKFL